MMDSSNLKEIDGYIGYFVSKEGDVYSAWIPGKFPILTEIIQRKLIPGVSTNGYKFVNLRFCRGKYIQHRIHRLVCAAFNGEPGKNMTASHLDGNINNNNADNLVWETLKDNHKRKVLHGTHDRGIKNSRAKINKEQLDSIRLLLKEGKLTHKRIGELYNVSRVFITKIKNNYRYNYD